MLLEGELVGNGKAILPQLVVLQHPDVLRQLLLEELSHLSPL